MSARTVPGDLLAVGKVSRPHGVRGEIKVYPYGEEPLALLHTDRVYLAAPEGEPVAYRVVRARQAHHLVILQLEEVRDRNAAEALIGREVLVPATSFPPLEEGEYYVHQLIGLRVVTEEGEELGTVREIFPTGANDVWEVEGPRGEVLLPDIPEVIKQVDLDKGVVVVHLLPGLLE